MCLGLPKKSLDFCSYDIKLEPDAIYKSQKLYFNNQQLFNIVEGCNGLSVIILFSAFVIAFKIQTIHDNRLYFIWFGKFILYEYY